MTQAGDKPRNPPMALDDLLRVRLQAIEAPVALHDRVRALIAIETQGEDFSDSQWRM